MKFVKYLCIWKNVVKKDKVDISKSSNISKSRNKKIEIKPNFLISNVKIIFAK